MADAKSQNPRIILLESNIQNIELSVIRFIPIEISLNGLFVISPNYDKCLNLNFCRIAVFSFPFIFMTFQLQGFVTRNTVYPSRSFVRPS